MFYSREKKTLSNKVITSKLSWHLEKTKVVNSGKGKTSSVNHNQKQNDENKSEISEATSFHSEI